MDKELCDPTFKSVWVQQTASEWVSPFSVGNIKSESHLHIAKMLPLCFCANIAIVSFHWSQMACIPSWKQQKKCCVPQLPLLAWVVWWKTGSSNLSTSKQSNQCSQLEPKPCCQLPTAWNSRSATTKWHTVAFLLHQASFFCGKTILNVCGQCTSLKQWIQYCFSWIHDNSQQGHAVAKTLFL